MPPEQAETGLYGDNWGPDQNNEDYSTTTENLETTGFDWVHLDPAEFQSNYVPYYSHQHPHPHHHCHQCHIHQQTQQQTQLGSSHSQNHTKPQKYSTLEPQSQTPNLLGPGDQHRRQLQHYRTYLRTLFQKRLQHNRRMLIGGFRRDRLPRLSSSVLVRASIKFGANFKLGKIPVHYSGLLALLVILILALFNCCSTNLYPLVATTADLGSTTKLNHQRFDLSDGATVAALTANNQSFYLDNNNNNLSCYPWKDQPPHSQILQKFELVTNRKCKPLQKLTSSSKLPPTGTSSKYNFPNKLALPPFRLPSFGLPFYGLILVVLYLVFAIFGSKLFHYKIRFEHREDGHHLVDQFVTSNTDFNSDDEDNDGKKEPQMIVQKKHLDLEPIITELMISVLYLLPLRLISRLWGYLNDVWLPRSMRRPLILWYSRTFNCNLDEIEIADLTRYKNLGQFFRRTLKPNVRPIVSGTGVVVSAADGRIVQLEQVSSNSSSIDPNNNNNQNKSKMVGYVGSVKGIYYSVDNFLGPNFMSHLQKSAAGSVSYPSSSSSLPGGEHHFRSVNPAGGFRPSRPNHCLYSCVVYLAPGDYHRFHSPVEWKIVSRRHFSGKLFSVAPSFVGKVPNLFAINERVAYLGRWKYGFFSMTAVGATNVGSVRVYFDPDLHTNQAYHGRHYRTERVFNAGRGIRMKKGEMFGEFNLGSTVVLLFEAPSDRMMFQATVGQKIQYGQSVCKILPK